ncbi:MAG TPA: Ig-like domain-containing protein, partial [Pyrinomonadaceae bacterium]|nr:Ig-like domain-containing protein [Pyrinomonadaceae bacterium]
AGNFNDASPSTTADDISGTVGATSSYNLIGAGGSGGLVDLSSDSAHQNQVGVSDAGLRPLAANGAATQTHSLQCTSPAIDKGKAFGLTTDQRGLARVFDLADTVFPNAAGGDGTDIGALETQSGGGCLPTAIPPAPSTNEDTQSGDITLTGTYSTNTPLTFTVTQNPGHGTLTPLSAPVCNYDNSIPLNTCTATLKYTPATNFNGVDTFRFKVGTSGLDSEPADVNVTVNAVNDKPVATPQSLLTDEDVPLDITLGGTDVESSPLSFTIVSGPSHGTLGSLGAPSCNPGVGTCSSLVTYTPGLNYNGPDAFTFKVNDGSLDSTTVSIALTVNPVNDAPVAVNDAYNASENTPLTVAAASGVVKNDTDVENQTLTAQIVASPTHASSFALNADGSFNYTPAANFVGTDTFTYKANDSSAQFNLSNVATVTITVNAGGLLQFSAADYPVVENAGTATVTVTRTAGSSGATSIKYATNASGTAAGAAACAAGVDFVNTTGTLSWADGDTAPKTFTVTICDDSLYELDKTVGLALSDLTGSAEPGTQTAATVTITDDDAKGGVFGFSQATYTVGERDGFVNVTVTRTGDTTRAANVDYTTDDGSDPHVPVPCSATTGMALERCDYTASFGTLKFAAGEPSKTVTVLITDDSYVEGLETTLIKLSNPTDGGALALGGGATATIQITDDVPESAGNRNDDDESFVTEHYHDFLGRHPDAAGLKFWVDGIKVCGNDQGCRLAKRINTSAAFFLSIEFQNTGFYAYRVHKAAFGDEQGTYTDSNGLHQVSVPAIRLRQFLRDSRVVGQNVVVGQGAWQAQIEANKQALALEVVQRPEFIARYPALTSATAFVGSLDTNTGGVLTDAQRSNLIAELSPNPSDPALRADVLKKVAEVEPFQLAEYNRAFVLMQYYGYLRRNPNDAPEPGLDYSGYIYWLTKLNQFNGNFVEAEMVKAFL